MNPVLSRRRPWRDDPHLRLAVRLARSLTCLSSFGPLQQGMMRLHNRVAALQATWQRLQLAEERNYQRSRGMLLQQLSDGIVELRNSLGDLQHPITEAGYRPQVPTAHTAKANRTADRQQYLRRQQRICFVYHH